MFPVKELSLDQIELCRKTISSNAFYMLVADAMAARRRLSVVRMGDGEVELLDEISNNAAQGLVSNRDEVWQRKLGIEGLSRSELLVRLQDAADQCTYFAPSVSGISREEFHLHSRFAERDVYVDNFFVNAWTDEMRIALYKQAGHILFIHRNPTCAHWFRIRCDALLGVRVDFLQLDNWRQTEAVVQVASASPAPLVLFSAGPAGKYIGPKIEKQSPLPKVVIDLGNASDHWLLEKRHQEAVTKLPVNRWLSAE